MNNKGNKDNKKVVKKDFKKDAKKDIKEDFQIKAYLLLYRALKKLHTFKIQKVVRNLKKDNKKKEELESQGAKPEALEKVTKEVERLVKQKTKFDLVLKDHLKMLTLHTLHDEYSVPFEKHTEYFEKELPGFVQKIELFNQEDNSDIQLIKWFEESIKGHKVYVETSQNLEAFISKMQEVIDKNKAKKKNRKANKKQREKEAKKEGDAMEEESVEGDEANGEEVAEGEGQDIVISFSEDEEEEVKKPKNNTRSQTPKKENKHQEKRNQKKERDLRDKGVKLQKKAGIEEATGEQEEEERGPKKPVRDLSKKERIQHYKNLRKEYGENIHKPKAEAPKSNKRPGHDGGFKEEKVEKKFMRQDREQGKPPGAAGADRGRSFQARPQEEAVRPFDQLHPSWRANIEQKQKASIATFQGTREKLC